MKIYDCFSFYNEFEMLDIRLKMLNDVVDYFVLVELPKTYSGKEKPRYFEENKQRYAEYLDKIIYISSDEVPDVTGFHDWTIAYFQRNCIFYALNGRCEKNDIIILSDLDEIPDPRIIRDLKNTKVNFIQKGGSYGAFRQLCRLFVLMGWKRFMSTMILRKHRNAFDVLDFTPIVLEQRMFYFYMNLESEKKWYGTVIAKWGGWETPQMLRLLRSRIPIIPNAGYHFSYMGGAERVMTKLNSIVDGHDCDNLESVVKGIEECIEGKKETLVHMNGGDRYTLIDKESLGLEEHIMEHVESHYSNFFKIIN